MMAKEMGYLVIYQTDKVTGNTDIIFQDQQLTIDLIEEIRSIVSGRLGTPKTVVILNLIKFYPAGKEEQ